MAGRSMTGVRARGSNAIEARPTTSARSHGQPDRSASSPRVARVARSYCTETLETHRSVSRSSESGVTAVLVQARKEAAADAHLESVHDQAPSTRRMGR
jgi:hypothetical protein